MGGNFYKFWSSSLQNNSHLSLVTGMKVSVHILYLSTSWETFQRQENIACDHFMQYKSESRVSPA